MSKAILAALALGLVPALALGDCRRVVAAKKVVVVQETAVVAAFAAVPVALFQVGYIGPPAAAVVAAAPPSSPTSAVAHVSQDLASMQREIDRLRQENAALRNQPAGPIVAAVSPHKALLVGKCARCHDAGQAEAKGGGLALLKDGQLLELPAEVLLKIAATTYQGTMPKAGGKLNDEEVATLMHWLGATTAKK